MPINAICPECETSYQLADHQEGKKVRCKSCQAVFVAADSSGRRMAIRSDSPSPARTKPSALTARRGDPDEGVGELKRGKSAMPLIIGGAVVFFGLFLFLCGAVVYLLMRDTPTEVAKTNTPSSPPPPIAPPPQPPPAGPPQPFNQPPPKPAPEVGPPIQGKPVEQPSKPPQPAKPADTPAANDKKGPTAERSNEGRTERGNEERPNNGRLTAEGRERVKQATVFLRVKMADGTQASGSGFFGCKEARNIVLTNAHVVGMLSPDSLRPMDVEVVVNSGEANEWKTKARVLGVDRSSDLAVLDIGTPAQTIPNPLPVRTAGGLRELDEVYVFGFPLGEQLGKEITIRPASVSSLRRNKDGILQRVQVNGGMDPGNSGGPVVDNSGVVVGVAVSGIPGRQINFAIPGERVDAILNGRIAELIVQQPYFTPDNRVALPLVMDMIDPRNLIKEVGIEVWAGNKPPDNKSANRPSATTQPASQEGDSPHVYYKLKYLAPEGKGEIVLPELPQGKVYWKQPKWINGKGEPHWASANPMPLTSSPVTRKPANLVLRYTPGSKRTLDLTIENTFKVSSDDDSDFLRVSTAASFTESVASSSGSGTMLSLRYRNPPSHDLVLPGGKSIPNPKLEAIKNDLKRLVTHVSLDRVGNITRQDLIFDQRSLAQLARVNPDQIKLISEFHEMMQQSLEALSVSLPINGTAQPLESWKAERHVPIDTPVKSESGKLDVTYTFLGVRKRDGRDEAVISMDGMVRGKDDSIGGKADGHILVDLANGQTIQSETTVRLQLKALLSKPGEPPHELRVLDTIQFRMKRKL